MTKSNSLEFWAAAARWKTASDIREIGEAWDALREVVDSLANERAKPAREILKVIDESKYVGRGGGFKYQIKFSGQFDREVAAEIAALRAAEPSHRDNLAVYKAKRKLELAAQQWSDSQDKSLHTQADATEALQTAEFELLQVQKLQAVHQQCADAVDEAESLRIIEAEAEAESLRIAEAEDEAIQAGRDLGVQNRGHRGSR